MDGKDIKCELWREYDIPGRDKPYRIMSPQMLYLRPGGTTHRVLDDEGVVHCVPTVGEGGCVLRWQNRPGTDPVAF